MNKQRLIYLVSGLILLAAGTTSILLGGESEITSVVLLSTSCVVVGFVLTVAGSR